MRLQRRKIVRKFENIVISENAIFGLGQIFVRVKTGVEKRDGHTATGVAFIGVHPHRDW